MDGTTAVFGFPDIWDAAYEAHSDIYRAISKVQLVANEFVTATRDSEAELVQVIRALTHINVNGMADVLILTGNRRGAGAMKVARSMFEVSITAEYLENNPSETDLYLDFAHVIAWRQFQQFDRDWPGEGTRLQSKLDRGWADHFSTGYSFYPRWMMHAVRTRHSSRLC